jgi:hypothetical protein
LRAFLASVQPSRASFAFAVRRTSKHTALRVAGCVLRAPYTRKMASKLLVWLSYLLKQLSNLVGISYAEPFPFPPKSRCYALCGVGLHHARWNGTRKVVEGSTELLLLRHIHQHF